MAISCSEERFQQLQEQSSLRGRLNDFFHGEATKGFSKIFLGRGRKW